jgi:hypothetical protein
VREFFLPRKTATSSRNVVFVIFFWNAAFQAEITNIGEFAGGDFPLLN